MSSLIYDLVLTAKEYLVSHEDWFILKLEVSYRLKVFLFKIFDEALNREFTILLYSFCFYNELNRILVFGQEPDLCNLLSNVMIVKVLIKNSITE